MLDSPVPDSVRTFSSFAEAEKADREFYRKLSGKERLAILVELTKHEPEQRLERIYRVINHGHFSITPFLRIAATRSPASSTWLSLSPKTMIRLPRGDTAA